MQIAEIWKGYFAEFHLRNIKQITVFFNLFAAVEP